MRTRRRRSKSRRRNPWVRRKGKRVWRASGPLARSRRRKAGARKAARTRARRRRSGRKGRRVSSRRRTRRSRRPRFRTYRSLSRRHGPRKAARLWRRRRKYVRSNPFSGFLPSFGSITGVVKDGVAVGAGWLAVNAAMMLVDKVGLSKLKATTSPTVTMLINFGARAILTPFVAKLAGKFLGLDARKVALGGGFNAVYHGVQDLIAANPTMVPDTMKPLLLGYDGVSDYATMSDYATAGQFAGLGYTNAGDGGVILA